MLFSRQFLCCILRPWLKYWFVVFPIKFVRQFHSIEAWIQSVTEERPWASEKYPVRTYCTRHTHGFHPSWLSCLVLASTVRTNHLSSAQPVSARSCKISALLLPLTVQAEPDGQRALCLCRWPCLEQMSHLRNNKTTVSRYVLSMFLGGRIQAVSFVHVAISKDEFLHVHCKQTKTKTLGQRETGTKRTYLIAYYCNFYLNGVS
jgi:hypothetical protein